MNPHHLLLLGMAFFLMDILLDDAEANPTISSIGSIESFASQLDEIDLTLLNRALRQQGNDCDSQVMMLQNYILITKRFQILEQRFF